MYQDPASALPGDGVRSPEEVARGVFAAINEHDLDAMATYYQPDEVQDFIPIGVFTGRPAVLGVFADLFRALPDVTMTVEHVMANEQTAYVRWRLDGTFTGEPFQGIQSNGRRVDFRGTDAMEVEKGLIRRNTIFYDGADFFRDIGLLPARGSRMERILIRGFNLKTRLGRLTRRSA